MAAGEKAAFTRKGAALLPPRPSTGAPSSMVSTGLAAAAQTVGRAARSPLLDSRRSRA